MSSARDLLAAARVRAVNRFPYLSDIFFALRPCEKEGLGTLAVDPGARLFYDPKSVQEWGSVGTAAVIYHEAGHLLRDHFGRCGDRDKELWNLAGDAEINDDAIAAGIKFPMTPVTPKFFGLHDGEVAEAYYSQLQQKAKKVQVKLAVASGACGGCAGNPGQEGDGKDGAEAKDGKEGQAPKPLSPSELTIIRKKVAQDIIKHTKQMGIGSVPAGLRVWAEKEIEPPKIPWQQILAKEVRKAVSDASGAVDYSFRKLARSYWSHRRLFGAMTPLRPGLRRPIPRVIVVLDSSGSMMGRPFERALSETIGVVKAMGVPVETFAVDTQVEAHARIQRKGDLQKVAVGFGGTDMRAGIREADKSKPDVIVLLTDGETPWPGPSEMPRARLIVAIIGGRDQVPEHIRNVVKVDAGE